MALATVADVLRVMRLTGTVDPERDADLAMWLDSAQALVVGWLRWDPTLSGETRKFYDIREDGYVELPKNSAVSAVRMYATSDTVTPPSAVALTDYELQDGHRLRIRGWSEWPWDSGGDGDDDIVYDRDVIPWRNIERIEVDCVYGLSAGDLSALRDAIAICASALYQRAGVEAQGITSESIGGYSYALGGQVTGGRSSETSWMPNSARTLLMSTSLRRKTPLVVP